MNADEEVLARAAKDGSIEDIQWSGMFENVLQRLEHIVYKEFPIPSIVLPASAPPLPQEQPAESSVPPSAVNASDDSRKEDLPPPSSPPRPKTPPQSQPIPEPVPSLIAMPEGTLPPPLQATYDYVMNALTAQFADQPPHTIQRLAELILNPKEHHRFLHSYLNALDRVVSVSSGLNVSPDPSTEASAPATSASGPLVNGVHPTADNTATTSSFGDDDSLGGALLTPIPWLHGDNQNPTEMPSIPVPATATLSSSSSDSPMSTPGIDTPSDSANGTPQPATHSDADAHDSEDAMDTTPSLPSDPSTNTSTISSTTGVTQGELLRQQQQASSPPAAVSSITPAARNASPIIPGAGAGAEASAEAPTTVQEDPEQPHARGPEAIGMEDTGKQAHELGSGQVLDMEAAVGRPSGSTSYAHTEADPAVGTEAKGEASNEEAARENKTKDEPVVREGEGKDVDGDADMPDVPANGS